MSSTEEEMFVELWFIPFRTGSAAQRKFKAVNETFNLRNPIFSPGQEFWSKWTGVAGDQSVVCCKTGFGPYKVGLYSGLIDF